jgi:hypothetical protein
VAEKINLSMARCDDMDDVKANWSRTMESKALNKFSKSKKGGFLGGLFKSGGNKE